MHMWRQRSFCFLRLLLVLLLLVLVLLLLRLPLLKAKAQWGKVQSAPPEAQSLAGLGAAHFHLNTQPTCYLPLPTRHLNSISLSFSFSLSVHVIPTAIVPSSAPGLRLCGSSSNWAALSFERSVALLPSLDISVRGSIFHS